jgi:N-acyl-L-homoserine lactone synthetase
MIKILTSADRHHEPELFDHMFRARAAIFHDRLKWKVSLREGREIDDYDEKAEPVYLVSTDRSGRPTGSLRLLPTTGPTMLHNEFASLFDEPVTFQSPTAWECTRFCVHPAGGLEPQAARSVSQATRSVSSELLKGLCKLCLGAGIEHIVGLYDARMVRVYAGLGWTPTPVARSHPRHGDLIVGIWDASDHALESLTRRATARSGRPSPGTAEIPPPSCA